MDNSERKALIGTLRNQTEFGRLNESAIEAAFDKIAEMGYIVSKKVELVPAPKPDPMPEPEPEALAEHE